MITENLSTLKINKLTQAQYDRELAAGNIDENALYLTPEEVIDLSPYATIERLNEEVENITTELNYMDEVTSNIQTQLDSKSDSAHNHNSLYYTKTEIDSLELITVDDIDTICGSDIVAVNSEIIPGNTVCNNSTGKFYYVGPNTPDSLAAPARATINPVAVPLKSVPATITFYVPSGFLVGRMPLCVVDPSVSFTVDPNGANYQNFASYSAETLRDDGWQTPVNGVNTFEITEATANMFICTFKKTDGTVMTDDDIAVLNAEFSFVISYDEVT